MFILTFNFSKNINRIIQKNYIVFGIDRLTMNMFFMMIIIIKQFQSSDQTLKQIN
jgi:hypothetical protein